MIDLHTHIIPGIDDGAPDPATALAMLKMAAADGSTGLVATPHVIEAEWVPDWDEIVNCCQRLNQDARHAGINVTLYPGAEVMINMDLLKRIEHPGIYCINGGSYMLLELPALEIPGFTEEFLFKLQTKGITPIIAHPERNLALQKNLKLLNRWLERGILIQLNASSINGQFGKEVVNTATKLLTSGMVHCLGSDAHGVESRRPLLSAAVRRITKLIGAEAATQIAEINPNRILQSHKIEQVNIRTQQHWLTFWR